MPGLVGLIARIPVERAESQLKAMLGVMCHESSYMTGTWIDAASGVYVGWAARKGSFSDPMPLRNERGDVVLAFSGEEFPDPGTARHLKERGHEFNVERADYLVHLYEENPAFFSELNGTFHALLTDRARRRATLFNDRYGLHRLYYHEAHDAFYFAAEAKAILAVRPELRSADPRGLAELVACGCVLENRTLFRGIHVLPPSAAWVFQGGTVERKATYFQPCEWEEQAPLDPESYYREIRENFSRNLPRYFNGKERVGMSLTGGLDTRMIMAWQKCPAGSLPCYSFGGMFRDCQDVLVARQVADACGQRHNVIRIGETFLSRFQHYAERTVYLTDGCADVGHSPDLYANEEAATIAPVRMTGNYGGEILRRVRAFKPVEPAPGLFSEELLAFVGTARTTYGELLHGNRLSFAAFRQTPWHHYGLLALEKTQVSLRSPYLDNDFVKTVFRAPQSVLSDNDVCLRLIEDGDPALRRIRTDRGVGGELPPLAATLARWYQEFTFKAEYAYGHGMPPWLARIDHLASSLHLERLFLGRHKFYHFRVWYRDVLSNYVQEMLLDSRTLSRPYLQRKTLETMVRGHVKGNQNYTSEIHKVLTLELLHRLFLD
jgi:asparagine synthase (glutamine-hydrolysing)